MEDVGRRRGGRMQVYSFPRQPHRSTTVMCVALSNFEHVRQLKHIFAFLEYTPNINM
jgi:hypothetical protein